ncbi:MAG: AAA family ATPase [Candidatus Brockarchaeota archaeon]|nr:AAA family ATPase [Candidatus Brockarchaeota archaeon]
MSGLKRPRRPIIILTGMHGVGKSTYARPLAEEFNLEYVSTGIVFRKIAREKGLTLIQLSEICMRNPEFDREIDNVTISLLESGGVVLDSLLAGWFARDVESFKIFLKAPFEIRCKRIASRENRPLEEIISETRARENSEKKRFMEYYGFNIEDLSLYDMVLDTGVLSQDAVSRILKTAVSAYLEEKWVVENA